MKRILLLFVTLAGLTACDKQYICNCVIDGNLPHKKIYLKAKTDGGAERQCRKNEEGEETCTLQE
jgi:hypothetical protein